MRDAGFYHVDSFVRIQRRGTWYSTFDGKYYENDYYMCDDWKAVAKFHGMRTVALSCGDHFRKLAHMNFAAKQNPDFHKGRFAIGVAKEKKKRNQEERRDFIENGFDGSLRHRRKLRYDRFRGSSVEAQEARERIGMLADRKVEGVIAAHLESRNDDTKNNQQRKPEHDEQKNQRNSNGKPP